jgi:hypothetical protein
MSLGSRGRLAATVCIAAACLTASAVPGRADSTTDPLVPASGALLGAFANGVGGESDATALAQIQTADGRPLTVVNRYAPWRQTSFNAELGDFAAGRIPMISWSPGGTTTAAAIVDGSQDAVIENAAQIMKSWGHPFFLRLAYEMDQPPGSPRYIGPPDEFIAAWQRVYDIFQQVGATNARFVWCAIGANFATGKAQSFYPGSQYVDWIAADAYNWYPAKSKWATYSGGLFNAFYAWASQQGKPLMIAETGSMEDPAVAGRKAAWILDAASWVESHPDIKAWVYFSSVSPKGYTFQLSTSTSAQAAFAQVADTPYFEAQPGGSSQDPPPPPPPPASLGLRGVLVTPRVFDPRRQLLWIRFRTSVRATDEIQVRTAGWRVVRTKALGSLSAAGHAADWRGRNDAGRMLPPGRYWVRFCATAGDLRIAGLWHEVTLL